MKLDIPTALQFANPPKLSEPLADSAIRVPTSNGTFSIDRIQLTTGKRNGVELLLVEAGRARAAICPTRGLGLWRANLDGVELGWNSPVAGPVHPAFVPLSEPSGLGWLDGFDELLVRCGLQSFGAPDFHANGQLKHTLHGRIANLPAHSWELHVDPDRGQLEVRGEVHETRFLIQNLRLKVKYVFKLNEPTIEVFDEVINAADMPTSMQLLYHINVGQPLLQQGARIHLPANRIVARDARAAEGLDDWQVYRGPEAGYAEQVYFSTPTADDNGWTTALLTKADNSQGFALEYHTGSLPCFTQWKNTIGVNDGYVTGLEPGTGFPNTRSFEESKGRLVMLQPGEKKVFQLRLHGLGSDQAVENQLDRIAKLNPRADQAAKTESYDPSWCVPR